MQLWTQKQICYKAESQTSTVNQLQHEIPVSMPISPSLRYASANFSLISATSFLHAKQSQITPSFLNALFSNLMMQQKNISLHSRAYRSAKYKVWSMSTPVYLHCQIAEWLAAELYAHLPFCCWINHSWEQTTLGILSGHQHRWSGTHRHRQSSDLLSVFKSRLKTFLFNQAFTEPWSDLPPRLWTYDHMAL